MPRKANTAPSTLPTWTTRTGQRIPLTAMSTAHLWNAINMLNRRMLELAGELNRRCATQEDNAEDRWDPRDDFSPGALGSD